MKYEISRKKLQEVKEKVLNDYIDNNVENFDTYIVIVDNTGNDNEFEITEPFFEYDYYDGRLFVRDDVFYNFISSFPINEKEAIEDISSWFQKKFDVEVKFVE